MGSMLASLGNYIDVHGGFGKLVCDIVEYQNFRKTYFYNHSMKKYTLKSRKQ